jgi:hypothetical protein
MMRKCEGACLVNINAMTGVTIMKTASVILLVLGCLFLAVAGINARNAPSISYLMGSFLPGLLCLIVGLALGKSRKTAGRERYRQEYLEDEDCPVPSKRRTPNGNGP